MTDTTGLQLSELPVLDLSDPEAGQDVHAPLAALRERTRSPSPPTAGRRSCATPRSRRC
jgi:hypothetical protein